MDAADGEPVWEAVEEEEGVVLRVALGVDEADGVPVWLGV